MLTIVAIDFICLIAMVNGIPVKGKTNQPFSALQTQHGQLGHRIEQMALDVRRKGTSLEDRLHRAQVMRTKGKILGSREVKSLSPDNISILQDRHDALAREHKRSKSRSPSPARLGTHSSDVDGDIPPLSHYQFSHFWTHEPVQDVTWEDLPFHPIHDHPINAKKQRDAIDQDYKEGLIDETLHEAQIHNSNIREEAVRHILQHGVVGDMKKDINIHLKGVVNPEFAHKAKEIRQVYRHDTPQLESFLRKQSLLTSPAHTKHRDKMWNRQIRRIMERTKLKQSVNRGRHSDFKDNWAPPDDMEPMESGATPPPSPPRSPSPSPHPLESDTARH